MAGVSFFVMCIFSRKKSFRRATWWEQSHNWFRVFGWTTFCVSRSEQTEYLPCKGSFYTSAFRHVCEGEQRIDLQAVNGIFLLDFTAFIIQTRSKLCHTLFLRKTLMEVQLFRFVPNRVGRGLLSLSQNHFHGRQGIASGWEQLAHVQSTK